MSSDQGRLGTLFQSGLLPQLLWDQVNDSRVASNCNLLKSRILSIKRRTLKTHRLNRGCCQKETRIVSERLRENAEILHISGNGCKRSRPLAPVRECLGQFTAQHIHLKAASYWRPDAQLPRQHSRKQRFVCFTSSSGGNNSVLSEITGPQNVSSSNVSGPLSRVHGQAMAACPFLCAEMACMAPKFLCRKTCAGSRRPGG